MIDWENVDTVLLDMDGTLLDLHFDNYFWKQFVPERYAKKRGIQPAEARANLHAQYDRIRGTLDWYCIDYWTDRLDLDIRGLKRTLSERIGFRHDAEQFLKWLCLQSKKRIVVTNAHPSVLQLKSEFVAIGDHLDQAFSSHEFGYPKERQEFWHALHARTEFNPERTLFVDDTEDILLAAETYGIKHLLHVNQPDLTQEPKALERYPSVT